MKNKQQPIWICHPEHNQSVNQYIEFRQIFELTEIIDSELCISADTNFVVKINGEIAGTGQFSDYPNKKTFSKINVTEMLSVGHNTIAILVHYCGISHFSYIPGHPGLWFVLRSDKQQIVSGIDTLCRMSPTYRQGDMPRITFMQGFTFDYNAVKDDNWMNSEYETDKTWKSAVSAEIMHTPVKRPLPMLVLKPQTDCHVITQGLLKRNMDKTDIIAEIMQYDFLSTRRRSELFEDVSPYKDANTSVPVTINPTNVNDSDGVYIIIDMGQEECGFIKLKMQAGAGTIVDIAIGEHLADMRVRAKVGSYNFASRYVCRNGIQQFTHHSNRYAGRYLELHITNIKEPFTLHYAGLIPVEYPLAMKGKFESPDTIMNQIFEISQRTMHLCMHEHYEDCPWREQAVYANDSRIQALAGYYAFGEYDMPRVSFDLLAQSTADDGYQDLCAPMEYPFTIPSFTMSWFLAIADHLLFSGDIDAAKKQFPRMRRMMTAYQSELIDELLPSPQGKRYWHFYDWAGDELSGNTVHPDKGGLTGIRYDAPLNLFYILALRAAASVAIVCNEETIADEWMQQANHTAIAVHEKLWNKKEQLYEMFVGEQATENCFAELAQSLAILCDVPDENTKQHLREILVKSDNGLIATTLSQSLYKFDALLTGNRNFASYVFSKISDDWGYMLRHGATSFWETIKGEADFGLAGSLCHGWSGLPAYFYQAYILGIKPTTPSFNKFEINPVFDILTKASGQVFTPHGMIIVAWKKTGSNYIGKITHPKELKLTFGSNNNKCDWDIETN